MPITVPVLGQEISATTFGAPVANEVNRLTIDEDTLPRGLIAAPAVSSAPSAAFSTFTHLPQFDITATLKVNRRYILRWSGNTTAVNASLTLLRVSFDRAGVQIGTQKYTHVQINGFAMPAFEMTLMGDGISYVYGVQMSIDMNTAQTAAGSIMTIADVGKL